MACEAECRAVLTIQAGFARSACWDAFWGAWQRSRCLREGEGVLAQIGKVRVKAPFASAVDVGGGRPKVARREGLCWGL